MGWVVTVQRVQPTDVTQPLVERLLAAARLLGEPPPESGSAAGPEETSTEQILAGLVALRAMRLALDAWEPAMIAAARARGVSWTALAPALGVASRQAAERRYLRVRPPEAEDPRATRDDRVQAERDRRAGDRAVTAWASDHGADLRQLAGQVSALTGLGRAAQPSLDRLLKALGDNDVAALLPLLAEAHPHLTGHPRLARQVKAVGARVELVRQETQRQRARGRPAAPRGQRDG